MSISNSPILIRAQISLIRRAAKTEALARLHAPIEKEVRSSNRRVAKAQASRDQEHVEAAVDDECERVEELLGLAFVAAQSFVTGLRNRVSAAYESGSSHPPSFCHNRGYALLKMGEVLHPGASYTAVEAINAAANYWKHHDDWRTREDKKGRRLATVWDVKLRNEVRTVEIVADLGMAPFAAGNLRSAAEKLGVKEFENLTPIRQDLRIWAEQVYKAVLADIAP